MADQEFDRQWEIARRIANYEVGGYFKPFITGGAAIDTYLKRKCKDFDVYMPNAVWEDNFILSSFLKAIGLDEGHDTEHPTTVLTNSEEYGECTLRNVIKGTLLGEPVHIEIITWTPSDPTASEFWNDTEVLKHIVTKGRTDTGFMVQVLSCFSVSTSMFGFSGTTCNNLVLNAPDRMISSVGNTLCNLEVYDISSSLMEKSLSKYHQYFREGPRFYTPSQKDEASERRSRTIGSVRRSYIKLGNDLVEIKSYPDTYQDGRLAIGEPEVNSRRDTAVSADITTWDLPSVRTGDQTIGGSLRPRPWYWNGPFRTAQELQPTREQAEVRIEEVRQTPDIVPPPPPQPARTMAETLRR